MQNFFEECLKLDTEERELPTAEDTWNLLYHLMPYPSNILYETNTQANNWLSNMFRDSRLIAKHIWKRGFT